MAERHMELFNILCYQGKANQNNCEILSYTCQIFFSLKKTQNAEKFLKKGLECLAIKEVKIKTISSYTSNNKQDKK